MKKAFILSAVVIFFSVTALYAQVENVSLGHDVYAFLKEMKVKKIISGIHDDTPNMSYAEVKKFLMEIEKKKDELSGAETELLNKFRQEFYTDEYTDENTTQLFGGNNSFPGSLSEFISGKEKFLYYLQNDYLKLYTHAAANIWHAQSFSSGATNAELYDIGLRAHGTILDNFGFNFSFSIGNVGGSRTLASIADPRLKFNFKFVENIEPVSNYDYTEGYLRYAITPTDNMLLALQLGREKIKFGYGYGNSLAISGEGPLMDLLRFDFRYGILSFTSIHASTVGEFNQERTDRYTKYIASNKINISLPNLFNFGIGESIVYSGRGLEWAYINPFLFYKYAEMSLQDRDNGTVFLDFQTNFIKDFEIQGTFFLDEDILSNLQDLQLFSNKTAYQLGFFWYEPFSLENLSLTCEYTKIRPYVYTHDNYMNTFTAFGTNLGHRIGPNSDEILARLGYNLSGRTRLSLEYRHQRSGKNIVDASGKLIKNVGGDVFQPYRYDIDDDHPSFLDGIRYNYDCLTAGIRFEPWREIFFDMLYNLTRAKNVTAGTKSDVNYFVIKMSIAY